MSAASRADQDPRLAELEAEAEEAHGRHARYKATVDGREPAAPAQLRKLKRESELADLRLSRAESALRSAEDGRLEQRERAEEATIEGELRRNPNRTDTEVARASGSVFTSVRAVRERLGLYPGPSL